MPLDEAGADDLGDHDGQRTMRDDAIAPQGLATDRGRCRHASAGGRPQHCPSPRELDDLELLLSGALAPRRHFDDDELTLDLPPELAEAVAPAGSSSSTPRACRWPGHSTARLEPLAAPAYGAFRRLHLTPAEAPGQYAGRLVVAGRRPAHRARPRGAPDRGARARRCCCSRSTGHRYAPGRHARRPGARHAWSPPTCWPATASRPTSSPYPLASHGDRRPRRRGCGETVAAQLRDPATVHAVTGEGDAARRDRRPWSRQDQPADDERGLVVFFTGLSGSGKSTLARALHDLILEDGRRTVTSLDGDVVRRNLSAGLAFSKADRETNIRRIGWVAAEIARHRGIAICSPIAPFDATRREVRAMVEEAGGEFVLVHVATPLEECERRDRKGLYAKARAGEIPEFTGISSPYEEPDGRRRAHRHHRPLASRTCLADLVPALTVLHADGASDRQERRGRSRA